MSYPAKSEHLVLLLDAVARGDRQALARLYEDSSAPLYGLLLRLVKRRDWADEALQNCFLSVWQKLEVYTPERGTPMAWLMTIARYRALNMLRMKRPQPWMPGDSEQAPMTPTDTLDKPDDPTGGGIEHDREDYCLKGLPEEQRLCVMLAYHEGYTHLELGRTIKAPTRAVRRRMRQGLPRLQEVLQEYEPQ